MSKQNDSLENIISDLDWKMQKKEFFQNRMSTCRRKTKYTRLFYIAMVLVFVFGAAFIYNVYNTLVYIQDARTAQANAAMMHHLFSDDLANVFHANNIEGFGAGGPNPSILSDSSAHAETEHDYIDDYEANAASGGNLISPIIEARLITDNPDIVAYLHVPGTNISQVVVQAADNNFYLYHDMFRQRNSSGAIFLDYANNADFRDRNTIIYGHNMRLDTMFHNLRFYLEEEHFNKYRNIILITEDKRFIYEIFAVLVTQVDFEYIQVEFEDDEAFLSLMERIKSRSIHQNHLSAPLNAQDNVLILSTCSNTRNDTRIAVAARLAGVISLNTHSD